MCVCVSCDGSTWSLKEEDQLVCMSKISHRHHTRPPHMDMDAHVCEQAPRRSRNNATEDVSKFTTRAPSVSSAS